MAARTPEQLVARALARAELLTWLRKYGAARKPGFRRIDIPQKWQGLLDGLLNEGRLLRHYETGKAASGKYKTCYLRVVAADKARPLIAAKAPPVAPSAAIPLPENPPGLPLRGWVLYDGKTLTETTP